MLTHTAEINTLECVCVCVCLCVCEKSIIDSLNLQPQQGCESSGSQATYYQDYGLPENDAVYFGREAPTFRKNVLAPSTG